METPQKVLSLDKVEAHHALSFVLIRGDEGWDSLERRLEDRRRRVDDRVQALLVGLAHQADEEAFVQIRWKAPGEDDRCRVLHEKLQASGEFMRLLWRDGGTMF